MSLKLRQAGKGPGQAKFESYLPNGQGGIQIFFEPCFPWEYFKCGHPSVDKPCTNCIYIILGPTLANLNLSPWYGHVILVSGYIVLTGVNWHTQKYICCKSRLHATVSISAEYGPNVVWHRCCVYPPVSNTTGHDDHYKSSSCVPMSMVLCLAAKASLMVEIDFYIY